MTDRWAPPRAVFFDAYGTLVAQHPSFEEIAARALRPIAPEVLPLDGREVDRHIERCIIAHRQSGRLVHYPAAAADAFWRATYRELLAERLPAERAAQAADALLAAVTDLSAWALYPDAPPALAAIRAAGLTLGILSNWEDWLDDLLIALNLGDTFDHVLVSGTLGLEKPDPAIFHHALTLAGVAPAELVYVGDSFHHDIEPCLALGIRAVLIDRHQRRPDAAGYERVTDLRDLPALLGLSA